MDMHFVALLFTAIPEERGHTRIGRHRHFFQEKGTPVRTPGYVVSTVWSKNK